MRHGERILRAVAPTLAPAVERLIAADWFRERVATGSVPESRWLAAAPAGLPGGEEFRWLEHAPLRFPCYPHEITASQLHAAARLTLSLARDALDDGWLLKDASAWNVLFDQGRPVFCDILSFVPADATGLWPAYAQFHRHFIIPLLMHRHLGVRTSRLFLSRRDGIEPEDARRMIRGLSAWRQPALEAVTLPALLGRRGAPAGGRQRARTDRRLNRYLLARTYDRLEGHLQGLAPRTPRSRSKWSDYETERDHYSAAGLDAKRSFVRQTLADPAISSVLDLGCNTGEFSLLAESLGKQVVAADYDEQSLETLLQRLRNGDSRIQPMLLDVGRPTPAVGWMNEEVPGIITRIAGRFDCIMMLGLIHHLLVSERATLAGVVQLLESLAARRVIVEWVERHDRRFQQIAGLNSNLYEGLSRESFELAVQRVFNIERCQPLPGGTRTLYECSAARRTVQ